MPPLLKHNFSTLPVAPQSCRIVTWHDDFLGYLFPYSSSLQLCLLVIQLLYLIMPAWHSIMFDIIFQLLLFVILKIIPGRLVIVCHAISYFMNFIELWLVTIQLFNIDSISTDRLYLSPQKHRWFQDVSDSGGKGENYQRALTLLNGYPEVTMHVDRSSATASSASICRFSSSSCHFWKGRIRRNGASFSILQSGRICR